MTVLEEIRDSFSDVEIGSEFTTAEIKRMVNEKYGRKEGSVIPSDCAYGMTNKGIKNTSFERFNIFVQLKRGVYKYVGDIYK
ncbi:MAG: hypothetical protein IKV21_04310 [Clostridia bacterium]|nr:hypothetical protein [Clostridia bacterium]